MAVQRTMAPGNEQEDDASDVHQRDEAPQEQASRQGSTTP